MPTYGLFILCVDGSNSTNNLVPSLWRGASGEQIGDAAGRLRHHVVTDRLGQVCAGAAKGDSSTAAAGSVAALAARCKNVRRGNFIALSRRCTDRRDATLRSLSLRKAYEWPVPAAACDFQAAFTIACFDNMSKLNLMLVA